MIFTFLPKRNMFFLQRAPLTRRRWGGDPCPLRKLDFFFLGGGMLQIFRNSLFQKTFVHVKKTYVKA